MLSNRLYGEHLNRANEGQNFQLIDGLHQLYYKIVCLPWSAFVRLSSLLKGGRSSQKSLGGLRKMNNEAPKHRDTDLWAVHRSLAMAIGDQRPQL